MATSSCWRCLMRPSQQRLLLLPAAPKSSLISPVSISHTYTSQFSTTARNDRGKAGERKIDTGSGRQHVRTGKQFQLSARKKNKRHEKPKTPGIGERKAFRKRIHLSNDNAIQVNGTKSLDLDIVTNPSAVGEVVSISDDLIDALRTVEAFKTTQHWKLFHSPHFLIRQETVDMAKQLTETVDKKETARMVVTGARGSGKSMMGLQALATGFMKKWVVINVPEGQDLVTASTEYSPIPNSELFSQPVYILKLMQTIQATNPILSQCRVELDHMHLPVTVSRGMSLSSLLTLTKDLDTVWPVFQTFWKELLLPGRPPIMFAVDGLNHIMQKSKYRSPSFDIIHAHDLGLIRMFTDALSGKTQFPNGAAILGVTTLGNSPTNPSLDMALEQAKAAQAGDDVPARDPFFRKYDERVFDALAGVGVLDVEGVSKPEARSLMEYWAASGILRLRVDEKHVAEKWTLAGGGRLAELETVALYDLRGAM